MGSRLMHTAIALQIMEQVPVRERERFLFGSVLPDGAVSGNSHFRIYHSPGRQTFDLKGFRERYRTELLADDLVLGYYLHLIQDMLLRKYLQEHMLWKSSRHSAKMLHKDYRKLNGYLTEQYDLRSRADELKVQQTDGLFEGIVFDSSQMIQNIRTDLSAEASGKAGFFTKEHAREYIAYAAGMCAAELRALEEGSSVIDALDISWEWGKQKLLVRIIRKLRRILKG